MREHACSALCRALLLAAMCCQIPTAHAQIQLPNGTAIPANNAYRDVLNAGAVGTPARSRTTQLSANPATYVNEGITTNNNFAIEPQLFSPLCDFSVRFIYKGGGARFGIGWYNERNDNGSARTTAPLYRFNKGDINQTAADSDIQLLVPFTRGGADISDDSLPLDIPVASIRSNPRYSGGLIGLALIPKPISNDACCAGAAGASCLGSCRMAGGGGCCDTNNGNATQYHYTEHKWNVQCNACTFRKGGPWYSHLIYRSTKLDNTFYLGFEDLDFRDADGAAGINGNDLDYEDFVFQFTGLTCLGAGQACEDSTRQGSCRIGVTECNGQGQIFCKAIVNPSTERCDGLDNDCNGTVDDNAPCPQGLICDRGKCVGSCLDEFPCPPNSGLVCDRGRCVNQGCEGVTCSAGQACKAGTCVSACDGVRCPPPTICSGGLCIDPCKDPTTGNTIDCGPKKTCVNGACVSTCDCLPCSSIGDACQASTGKCVPRACLNMSCPAGTYCDENGACASPCENAICPTGQECKSGLCQDIGTGGDMPNPDDIPASGAIATGCSCHEAPTHGGTGSSGLALLASMVLLAWALTRRS
ncbi:MAG: hypothetical protein JNJ46_08935 [Myxococcales bacterium]|nr:hypothetical protein [Myxococcales bacterium]